MKAIEPGLLPLFRGFMVVMYLILSCGLCTAADEAVLVPPIATLLMWLMACFLLVYLGWDAVHRRLGEYYLPTAILLASVVPIIASAAQIALNMAYELRGSAALPDLGGLYIWLLLPLLLLSSQYGLREMFAYSIGTSLLHVLLIAPLSSQGGPPMDEIIGQAFIRLLLFVIVGFVVVRITTAQRRQRLELAQKNTQLTNYAVTLEQLSTSRERNRMARELHDTLAHTLSAVSIQLEALDALWDNDPASARNMLGQTKDLTRSGLQEARRALSALRARPLEDLGLLLSLRNLGEVAAQRAGLALHLSLPPTLPELRPEVEQTLYRVAEEALNNVVRHADAKSVEMVLREGRGKLELTICDDGRGFAPELLEVNGHYGIVGMQERAALAGGEILLHSAPGGGTRVQLALEK
jgi:signal transduction histidine kinase